MSRSLKCVNCNRLVGDRMGGYCCLMCCNMPGEHGGRCQARKAPEGTPVAPADPPMCKNPCCDRCLPGGESIGGFCCIRCSESDGQDHGPFCSGKRRRGEGVSPAARTSRISRPEDLDYSDLANWWHASGLKAGGAQHTPRGFQNCEDRAEVDVFDLHGTNVYGEEGRYTAYIGEAPYDPKQAVDAMNRRGSSLYNASCRIWQPKYLQVTITGILAALDGSPPEDAIETARRSVEKAFDYFLEHFCTGDRPFIISGHSQGAVWGLHLVKTRVDRNPSLLNRFVGCYLLGVQVNAHEFSNIPLSSSPSQTPFCAAWGTTMTNPELGNGQADRHTFPRYVTTDRPVSVNPLSWNTTEALVPAEHHLGVMSFTAGEPTFHPEVQLSCKAVNDGATPDKGGCLVVEGAPASLEFLKQFIDENLGEWNLHEADFAMWWLNIRQNVEVRISAFLSRRA